MQCNADIAIQRMKITTYDNNRSMITYPECFVKLVGIDVGTGSWLSTTTAAAAATTAERVSSEKHDT
jgi:hypothetical protein